MTERFNSARTGAGGRTVQDVGGLEFGPVDRTEHDLTFYEKRVDALLMLLIGNQAFRVDALRRAIEGYAEQEYDGIPYYDRWMKAITQLLLEQEIISPDELAERVKGVVDRLEAEGVEVERGDVL